jgi:4,5-dihydroxyphthalate decarboxylase
VADLKLTLACWDYDRTRPLIDGRVKPKGIDLDIRIHRPRITFQRMLDNQEFQISELSLGSYTALKARGQCPFHAIPVALSKIFRHSCIYVRSGSGIRTPQDLKGKRVGTSQYSSTGLCFMRGMLQHEYGVHSRDMHWFMGGLNSFVEPPLIPLNLPPEIRLDFLQEGQTLEQMFDRGELDALLSLYIPNSFLRGAPHVKRLFPNFKEIEQDYYGRTQIFPIMHTVVVREDVHREHPWVAASLYKAFCDARDIAVDGLYDTDALRVALPFLLDHVEETWRVFGKEFWAYGLEPNRPTWAAIGQYVYEQALAPRVVTADELFIPGVEESAA